MSQLQLHDILILTVGVQALVIAALILAVPIAAEYARRQAKLTAKPDAMAEIAVLKAEGDAARKARAVAEKALADLEALYAPLAAWAAHGASLAAKDGA